VILTSNLAGTDAARQVGFGGGEATGHVYTRAAEQFFRPEFFNRLDRIVPFRQLSREEVQRIADVLIQELFRREGLVRRRIVLRVEPQAMRRIVDAGFHPRLGARALKRSLEQQLAQPVAAQLAAIAPDEPLAVGVMARGEGLAISVQPLRDCEPLSADDNGWDDGPEGETRLRAAVLDIENQFQQHRPSTALTAGGISPVQLRYFALQEQIRRVRTSVQRLVEAKESTRQRSRGRPALELPRHRSRKAGRDPTINSPRRGLINLLAANDMLQFVAEYSAVDREKQAAAALWQEVLVDYRLLRRMASSPADTDQVVLALRALTSGSRQANSSAANYAFPARLLSLFGSLFREKLNFDVEDVTTATLREHDIATCRLAGPFVHSLAAAEVRTHVHIDVDGALHPVQVLLWLLESGASGADAVLDRLAARQAWLADVEAGRGDPNDDPWQLGPVRRVYMDRGGVLDLRTETTVQGELTVDSFYQLFCAGAGEFRG
jgi:hypothetical protein